MMLSYIVADLLWIWVDPTCLPSIPRVVMFHHVVTILLLSIPLRLNKFHTYTCLDAVVEINTFFLIAKRQWPFLRQVMHWAYWTSFFPLRMVLYPYLAWHLCHELAGLPLYERIMAVSCQVILCGFNCMMLYASVKRSLGTDRKADSKLQGFCTDDLSRTSPSRQGARITAYRP